ncbi:hypothetical protein [Arthrobacter sp. H35-D1]|uniref:hypothetical protein n=1 Tax=Arthrobacter sp. H35-D1 TaxID=3046202 RepID=UPI0024BB31B7|nr:hypothetical protein [Arthrobacter sp. H35-D1]MDJ0315403.1 hypothetical protein [Arthrobacter sp. H35-D1]
MYRISSIVACGMGKRALLMCLSIRFERRRSSASSTVARNSSSGVLRSLLSSFELFLELAGDLGDGQRPEFLVVNTGAHRLLPAFLVVIGAANIHIAVFTNLGFGRDFLHVWCRWQWRTVCWLSLFIEAISRLRVV